MFVLKRQPDSAFGSATHVPKAPLALERLGHDAKHSARRGIGPPRFWGSEHEVAHLERLLAQPGGAGDGLNQRRPLPGSLRMAPIARLHQRGTIPPIEAGSADDP